MKKLICTIIMTALVGVTFAQNYKYHINWVRSNDNLEIKEYSYDENNFLIATYLESKSNSDEFYLRDTMTYDANGNITRLSAYQMVNGSWRYVNYCDYTYNELNQRTTRKNYNNFGGNFELGGTYRYYYDENGDQNYFELDFINMVYQKCERVFDDNHHMLEENGQQYSFSLNTIIPSWRIVCNYNDDGYIIEKYNYGASEEGGPLTEINHIIYIRDSNNNIIEEEYYSAGTVVEKHVYSYDESMLFEDLVPVVNPEEEWPSLRTNYNVLIYDERWQLDDYGSLQLLCKYEYDYTNINDSAIEAEDTDIVVYPNPVSDVLKIKTDDYKSVEIIDMTGKIVFSSEVENILDVDVKEFETGVYFLKLHGANGTSTRKVIVK